MDVDPIAALEAFRSMSAGAQGIWFFGTLLGSGQALKWVAEWRQWRKLPVEQRQANREGFTAQVDRLTRLLSASDQENRRTRAEIAGLRREYEDYRQLCHEENDALRTQVSRLQGDLEGLRRTISAEIVAAFRLVRRGGDIGATEAIAAIERVARLLGDEVPAEPKA